jgi:predicted nucleic acid-binding protein
MHRIKAVLDTNIIISGIVSPKGSPRKLLELAKEETFKVVTESFKEHGINSNKEQHRGRFTMQFH